MFMYMYIYIYVRAFRPVCCWFFPFILLVRKNPAKFPPNFPAKNREKIHRLASAGAQGEKNGPPNPQKHPHQNSPRNLLGKIPLACPHLVAPYCAIPRDYLSDTPPAIARYGVFGVATWPIGCDTPSPFSENFALGEHAKWRCDTPPSKGVSQRYLRDTLWKQRKSLIFFSLVFWYSLVFSNQGNSLVFWVFLAVFLCFSRDFMGCGGVRNSLVFWVVFLGIYLNTKEKKIRDGCDTPLCDTISKGYCAMWGRISHWAAKCPQKPCLDSWRHLRRFKGLLVPLMRGSILLTGPSVPLRGRSFPLRASFNCLIVPKQHTFCLFPGVAKKI